MWLARLPSELPRQSGGCSSRLLLLLLRTLKRLS